MSTVREVLAHVREDILDDFPGQSTSYDWVTDDDNLLWTNANLVAYFRLACLDYSRRRPILDSTTAAVCSYNVTAATHPEVAIHSSILRVREAQLQSRIDSELPPLTKVPLDNLMEDRIRDWRSIDTDIDMYTEGADEFSIKLLGVLAADDTLLLRVWRTWIDTIEWPFIRWKASTVYALDDIIQPTVANGHWYKVTTAGTSAGAEPTWPTDGTTVNDNTVVWQDQGLLGSQTIPDIPARDHLIALPHFMAHRAYMKHDGDDESGTINLALSNWHLESYENRVGPYWGSTMEQANRILGNRRKRTQAVYR